jgi:hypothetical protein
MISELQAIQRLLWEDWDPIGVNGFGPDDEYDSYALLIHTMLNEGKGASDIAEFLHSVAIENMGLSEAGNCAAIAQRLIEIHEMRR